MVAYHQEIKYLDRKYMEFSIGSQFSREFSFEDSSVTRRFSETLNEHFNKRNYGDRINKIYIGVICVSKGFEPFFMVRPPKIMKKESAIEYELKLDFDKMFKADEEQRKQLLASEIFKVTKKVFAEKKIDGFSIELFIDDLESYLNEQGYLENQ